MENSDGSGRTVNVKNLCACFLPFNKVVTELHSNSEEIHNTINTIMIINKNESRKINEYDRNKTVEIKIHPQGQPPKLKGQPREGRLNSVVYKRCILKKKLV